MTTEKPTETGKPIQPIDEFMKKAKDKKGLLKMARVPGCGCGCFTFIAAGAIGLCSLWALNAILETIAPEKKAPKQAPLMKKVQVQETKPAVPVDVICGYSEVEKSISDPNMKRAVRYVMLACAQETAKNGDYWRIHKELQNMKMDPEKNVWDWAAVRVFNQFKEDEYTDLVPTAADSKPGTKSLTYEGMQKAILGYKNLRVAGLQNGATNNR